MYKGASVAGESFVTKYEEVEIQVCVSEFQSILITGQIMIFLFLFPIKVNTG